MTGGRERAGGRGVVKTLVLGVCFGVSLLLMFFILYFLLFCVLGHLAGGF